MTPLKQLTRSAALAFDFLFYPIWVLSADTHDILFSNRAMQDWLGYGPAELEALRLADLQPPEERGDLQQLLLSFVGDEVDLGTWAIVGRAGTTSRVSIHWRKLAFEGADAIIATVGNETDSYSAAEEANAALLGLPARSEANFRHIFEAAPGKMIVVRPRTFEIVATTEEFARATLTNREEICGRSFFEVFPDDPENPSADTVASVKASFERATSFSASDVLTLRKYPIRRKDGAFEERYWISHDTPIYDTEGAVAFIIHRVEDVSGLVAENGEGSIRAVAADKSRHDGFFRLEEMKASLMTLQESETRLRTAERLLELGPWMFDFATGALHWAQRVFDIYGVPQNRAAPDFDGYVALVHPDDRQEMIEVYRRFEQSGDPQIVFQHRIIRSNGTIGHVRGVGERHRVDGKHVIVGFVQDISEVTVSQFKLAEMFRQQRIAGRLARLGSWRFDVGSHRLTWSPETAEIHEEPPGHSPSVDQAIGYYAPEHRETIRTAFSACVERGAPFDETLQLVTAKGNRVWVRAIGEAVRGPTGAIVAVEGAFQDISELVAARDNADNVARRLHQTLEDISDAFVLINTEDRIAYLNGQAEALLHRPRTELLGKNIWDEYPGALNSTFQREYRKAVGTGSPTHFETYFAPLDGWFSVDIYPTAEDVGVYFRDVSRTRARDEQLRLLEASISRQNDILLITEAKPISGPDGPKIVYVNDAFVRRTGYSREEVIGRTPRLLQGPKTQRHELDRIRAALEKWQPVRAELINYTKAGDEFWLELDIVPIADESGWYTHWVSVERDISDRKRAEAELRARDERFQLVARASNDVIRDWDLKLNTVWWNQNLKHVCGYDPAEVESGPLSWINRIHPEDRQRVLDSLHHVIDGSETHWSSEYRFIHRNGHSLTVVDRGFVIRNQEQKAVRMLGSMLDVTQRRELESKFAQSQKLEAVGQLTGGIAHDFNNLLTVILGNSELLFEDLSDRPNLRVMAEMSMSAAQRGAEMTKRLLAFARKQALEPVAADLNQLVAGMESLLRRTLGEQIDIEVIRAGRLWTVEIDASQLETALLNLAINARDAMPEGGALTIETANAALDDDYVASIGDIASGQYVLLTVTDTGHGIPRDIIDQVFEPFFTTKEVGKGSGLGLSMVYGFVRQSGGHIRVYSEPGEGTSFKLYFPRSFIGQEHQPQARVSAPVLGGQEQILVVEDDSLVCENLANQLERLGYRVLTANSGDRALKILEATSDIDLLFTDVVMPGMNGKQLADRALAMRPGLKVLFTSGYTENAIVHHGRLDRGVDLLSKPYRRDQLAAKLRKILGS